VTFDGKSAGISGRAFRDHSRGLRDLTAHQGALFLHGEFSGGRSVCALSVHDAGEADLAMAVTVDDGHLGAGTIDGFHATSQLPHPGDVYRFQVSTGATIELLTVTVLDVLVGSYSHRMSSCLVTGVQSHFTRVQQRYVTARNSGTAI
jgi:type VI protein secretion system component Hcp